MALRAGYYGIKKSLLSKISQLSNAVIIKSIGSGLTLSEAGELSSDSSGTTEVDLDFSTFTDYVENASVMSVNKTADSVTFQYGSGGAIGARVAKVVDISSVDFVKVHVDITSLYSASFPVKLGIATSTTSVYNGTYVTSSSLSETGDLLLDVRGLNGDVYLTFDGSGSKSVFTDGKLIVSDI